MRMRQFREGQFCEFVWKRKCWRLFKIWRKDTLIRVDPKFGIQEQSRWNFASVPALVRDKNFDPSMFCVCLWRVDILHISCPRRRLYHILVSRPATFEYGKHNSSWQSMFYNVRGEETHGADQGPLPCERYSRSLDTLCSTEFIGSTNFQSKPLLLLLKTPSKWGESPHNFRRQISIVPSAMGLLPGLNSLGRRDRYGPDMQKSVGM